MIISKEKHSIDHKTEMRGGKGTIHIKHLVNQDILCDKGRLYAQITVEPGCSIGNHEHVHEKEIFYVLSGTAEAMDNGEKRVLNSGDVLVTSHENSHSIENIGTENLEMMALILYGDEKHE